MSHLDDVCVNAFLDNVMVKRVKCEIMKVMEVTLLGNVVHHFFKMSSWSEPNFFYPFHK